VPTFVKIEKGLVPKAEFDRHVAAHRDYVRRLASEGRRARSGYWAERGGGMMVFEARDLDEARRVVEEDPLVRAGCVAYELHEWVVAAE
jgi:uncharacterized protein YciI